MLLFNRLFGVVLTAASVYVCVASLSFPSPYYVFGLGLILGLCSIAMVVKTFLKPRSVQAPADAASESAAGESAEKKPALGKGELNIIITIALTFAYVLAMQPLGFVVASIIFMIILMRVLGYKKIWHLIVIPPPFVVVIYLFFTRVIHINLPSGLLPF